MRRRSHRQDRNGLSKGARYIRAPFFMRADGMRAGGVGPSGECVGTVSSKRKGGGAEEGPALAGPVAPASDRLRALRALGGRRVFGRWGFPGTPCYRLDRTRNKQGVPTFCRDHFYVRKQTAVEMLRTCWGVMRRWRSISSKRISVPGVQAASMRGGLPDLHEHPRGDSDLQARGYGGGRGDRRGQLHHGCRADGALPRSAA